MQFNWVTNKHGKCLVSARLEAEQTSVLISRPSRQGSLSLGVRNFIIIGVGLAGELNELIGQGYSCIRVWMKRPYVRLLITATPKARLKD